MTRLQYLEHYLSLRAPLLSLVELVPEDRLEWSPGDSFMKMNHPLWHLGSTVEKDLRAGILNDYSIYGRDSVADPSETVATLRKGFDEVEDLFRNLPDGIWPNRETNPPWMSEPMEFWSYCQLSADHLKNHKMQLFSYLKLLGYSIHTGTLYDGSLEGVEAP